MLYSSITSYHFQQILVSQSAITNNYLSRNIINSTFFNIADKQNALHYHYRS